MTEGRERGRGREGQRLCVSCRAGYGAEGGGWGDFWSIEGEEQ